MCQDAINAIIGGCHVENKLPKKLKILGHIYTVTIQNENKTANSNLGTHWGKENKIWINSNQCQEMLESCLLHESLEAINYHLELKLKHEMIMRLETALYQLLKENPLWITKT